MAAYVGLACEAPPPELQARNEPIVNGVVDTEYHAVGRLGVVQRPITVLTCSGTLIGQRTVLTAAHCLMLTDDQKKPLSCSRADAFSEDDVRCDPDRDLLLHREVAFVLGCGDTNGCDLVEGVNRFTVESYQLHPSYDPRAAVVATNARDLAILKLAQAPAGFTPMPVAAEMPPVGATITLVGFGATASHARNLGVRRRAVNTVAAVVDAMPWFRIDARVPDEATVCYGDSGGAALLASGDLELVAGVITHNTGTDCGLGAWLCQPDLPWLRAVTVGDLLVQGEPGASGAPDAGADATPSAETAPGDYVAVLDASVNDSGERVDALSASDAAPPIAVESRESDDTHGGCAIQPRRSAKSRRDGREAVLVLLVLLLLGGRHLQSD